MRKIGLLVLAATLVASLAFAGTARKTRTTDEEGATGILTTSYDITGLTASQYLPLDAFELKNADWQYITDDGEEVYLPFSIQYADTTGEGTGFDSLSVALYFSNDGVNFAATADSVLVIKSGITLRLDEMGPVPWVKPYIRNAESTGNAAGGVITSAKTLILAYPMKE